jgi:hypothetical protein
MVHFACACRQAERRIKSIAPPILSPRLTHVSTARIRGSRRGRNTRAAGNARSVFERVAFWNVLAGNGFWSLWRKSRLGAVLARIDGNQNTSVICSLSSEADKARIVFGVSGCGTLLLLPSARQGLACGVTDIFRYNRTH